MCARVTFQYGSNFSFWISLYEIKILVISVEHVPTSVLVISVEHVPTSVIMVHVFK